MDPAMMAVLLVGSALVNLLLASFVWARRAGRAGQALVWVILSATVWSLSYAVELLAVHNHLLHQAAGDLKYVGIGALPVAWLIFTLLWSGRDDLVTSPVVIGLLIEPVLIMLMLAIPRTHNWVRIVPLDPDEGVKAGPLFWVQMGYVMVLMVGTAIVFVTMLARRTYAYRPQVFILAGCVLLPFVASVAFNANIAPLNQFDFTPVAFTISCGGLTWGILQQHLLRLAPVAHSQVIQGMADGVIVVDALGHVVECNPAGLSALGWSDRIRWHGQVLPSPLSSIVTRLGTKEVRIESATTTQVFEAQVSDLPDQRSREGGRLIVLRDISERRRLERQRATMLAEQARVAETLSRSLRPATLPEVPGVALGAEYRPAGSGDEIGGDFYDVYSVDDGWAFSLGDVSGKGARSAAVTALARYTLRALTRGQDSPSETIQALNAQLLAETEDQEIYLTVVHGRLVPVPDGLQVSLSLGGHPRPLLVPADESRDIGPVGEPGTAIGLLDMVETTDTTLLLAPGDALVSFTDGVTEARSGREFFGEEGLAEVLEQLRGASAQTIAEGVLASVLRYQEDLAADDIAVLVLQAPGIASPLGFDLSVPGAVMGTSAGGSFGLTPDGPQVRLESPAEPHLPGQGAPDESAFVPHTP